MFGWTRKPAVDERAKLIARMMQLIKYGMRTKSYERFVEAFSNPDGEPDVLDRYRRESNFTMTMSPTCWYSATVLYPHDAAAQPLATLQGGGDDYGVFITTAAAADSSIRVELRVPTGRRPGRDARIMIQSLRAIPGWAGKSEFDRLFSD